MRIRPAYIASITWLALFPEKALGAIDTPMSRCLFAYKIYLSNNPTKQDINDCLYAAKNGYLQASYILGLFYELGLGVSKDEREAIRHYRAAAQGGHIKAQATLNEIEESKQYINNQTSVLPSPAPNQSNIKESKNPISDDGFSLTQIIFFCAIGYLLLGVVFGKKKNSSSGAKSRSGNSRRCLQCNGTGKVKIGHPSHCRYCGGVKYHRGGAICVHCDYMGYEQNDGLRDCHTCLGRGFT